MDKSLTIFILLVILSSSTLAQKRRLSYKQKIPLKYWVTDSYTIKDGKEIANLQKGDQYKFSFEKKENGQKGTFEFTKNLTDNFKVSIDKKETFKRRLYGKANVYLKEEDYSKIYLDFWLTYPTYFSANQKLTFYSKSTKTKEETLKKQSGYRYYKVSQQDLNKAKVIHENLERLQQNLQVLRSVAKKGDQSSAVQNEALIVTKSGGAADKKEKNNKSAIRKTKNEIRKIFRDNKNNNFWAHYAQERIEAIDQNGISLGSYYKKYPEGAYIELKNREYIKLNFTAVELSALTIPFKSRAALSNESAEVNSNVTAGFNVSTFIGYSIGSLKYINKASEKVKPFGSAFTLGSFFGINSLSLDASSTSLMGSEALNTTVSSASISAGFGLMYNIWDFNIGIFKGWDFGFGETGKLWNYDGEPWFGFGLGYNITMLGKKSE